MITTKALGYRYPRSRQAALNNINLNIPSGTLFGLIGPNGAGKTTLISLLTGLLSSGRGQIRVMDRSPADDRRAVRRITGYVPQDYAFYPSLTVLENLRFFAAVQGVAAGERARRIDYCLELCQLGAVAGRHAGRLSGGLKRRLNIAAGLLGDPKVLYLDEPTAGIDPQSRAFILDRIRELNREGRTVIYTSHYMEEVEKLCDRVAIIDHGDVLIEGTLTELHERAGRDADIQCDRALSTDETERLKQHFPLTVSGDTLSIPVSGGPGELAGLLRALDGMDVSIRRLNYRHGDLESLFLQLTRRELRDS